MADERTGRRSGELSVLDWEWIAASDAAQRYGEDLTGEKKGKTGGAAGDGGDGEWETVGEFEI